MLVKPMHTRILLEQIEKLLANHEAKLKIWSTPAPVVAKKSVGKKKSVAKKVVAKKFVKKVATRK